jgi:hypothetical protein
VNPVGMWLQGSLEKREEDLPNVAFLSR